MSNSDQKTPELGTTSSGIQPNIAGALAYVLGIITGVIFFLIEKENKYVRFHAMQSILLGVAWIIICIALSIASFALRFIPVIGLLLNTGIFLIIGLGGFVLWLFLMYKAYQGEKFKLPGVGDMAEKNA
jgi:uncharacterized membrane protein